MNYGILYVPDGSLTPYLSSDVALEALSNVDENRVADGSYIIIKYEKVQVNKVSKPVYEYATPIQPGDMSIPD